ncbi:unnamed protein product [Aphanomyces euteiches]
MRKPSPPTSLIPFFRLLLLATASLSEGDENTKLEKPVVDFESSAEYFNTFAPLLLEECKSDIVEAWKSAGALQNTRLQFQSEQSRDNMRTLTLSFTSRQTIHFRNHDVLYIRGLNTTEAFTGVYFQHEKKDKLKLKSSDKNKEIMVYILGSEEMTQELILNPLDEFNVKVLGNLTTSCREYVALTSLDFFPAHLRSVVLSPATCKSHKSTLGAMIIDFDKCKESPGESANATLKEHLRQLGTMSITLEDLRLTNIGVAVRKLSKYKEDPMVAELANSLYQKWRKTADRVKVDDSTVAPQYVPQPLWDVLRNMYNQSQLQSIHSALGNYDTGVSLLQGPPGTGKTKTILGLVSGLLSIQLPTAPKVVIKKPAVVNFNVLNDSVSRTSIQRIKNQSLSRQRLNGVITGNSSRIGLIHRVTVATPKVLQDKPHTNHILICAPSNGAVDELISRLRNDGIIGPTGEKTEVVPPALQRATIGSTEQKMPSVNQISIIRLGSTADDAPDCVKQVCLKSAVRRNIEIHPKYQAWKGLEVRENQLRDRIRAFHAQKDPEKKKDKREMTNWHRELSEVQGKKRRLQEEVQNLEEHITTSLLTQANIIACTLSKCGSGDLNSISRGFDAVIIDEAAQAVEVSTLIPFRERVARVILVGDPKQLPATVKSVRAQEFLYNRSLFERLAEGGVPRSILRVQYRMHPFLRLFPSKCFYGGLLRDGEVIGSRILALGDKVYKYPYFQPFLLFNIDGREENGSGGSKCNRDEAQFGMAILKQLYQKISLVRANQWSIGFITPYKEQVNVLRQMIREQGYADVEVNTVDGFQA